MHQSRILIVDDNRTVLKVLSSVLERAGFEVATREEPIGTTVALMREQPDLVILDVNMPALEGDELVRSIRKRSALDHVFVVLYSALPESDLAELARACGADAHIQKNTPIDTVVRKVRRWIVTRPRVEAPGRLASSA